MQVPSKSSTEPAVEVAPSQVRFQGLVPIVSKMKALVVGCGALGSHLCMMLARMGIASLDIVDHDTIEPANMGVQDFTADRMGGYKAIAVENNCRRVGMEQVWGHPCKFESYSKRCVFAYRGFTHVFVCVDSMVVRDIIMHYLRDVEWEGILIDGRLAANVGWVYVCRTTPEGYTWYEKTLFKDEEAVDVQQCAGQMTGYSAHVVAGIQVAQAIRHAQEDLPPEACGIDLNNMLFFGAEHGLAEVQGEQT